MPTREEEELEASFDQAIADTYGPTDPQALFRLGQAFPEVSSIDVAVQGMLVQPDAAARAAYDREFDDTAPRPFQGVSASGPYLEEIIAEQERAIPLFNRVPAYSGDPANLANFYWRDLSTLESRPLRQCLRNAQGQETAFRIREVPITAFLTTLLNTGSVPWTDAHVFVDPPIERPNEDRLPREYPDLWVRFVIGYTLGGSVQFEGTKTPPKWVLDAAEQLPATIRSKRPGTR